MLKSKLGLEIVWLIMTAVITCLVMLPIYSMIGNSYPFYWENVLVIIIAITFCRYIFLLKYHWVSNKKWIKILFIFIPVPIFFFLIGAFYDFQAFTDEHGINSVMGAITPKDQLKLSKFIRSEMILFWSTAFLANAYMPIRMIISLYREVNKGTH